jgi:Rrf2 family iron-sulfur cluster assembly transcriptional regulator
MLSSACQDTIRACVWLSTRQSIEFFRIQTISDELNLPYHFLAKSLQKLVHANILVSSRGAAGGVKLSRDTSDIALLSIIKAVDGEIFFDSCVLGMGDCESETPCSLHAQWHIWRTEIHDMYEVTKLSEISEDFFRRKVKRL